jgi:hypothetical protein
MTSGSPNNAAREEALRGIVLALPLYYCDPIIIGRHPDIVGDANAEVFSGSATYLELPSRKIIVTNAHVIRKYQEMHDQDARTILQLPNRLLSNARDRIIDIDDASDLATLDATDIELSPRPSGLEELRPRQFYRPVSWPPSAVNEGDVILSGGWPKALRHDTQGMRNIEHNPYSIAAVAVTLAMPDRFRIRLDRNELTTAFGKRDWDEKDYDFRGMSGAPVLRRNPLNYELVGIISEYREPPYDTFAVTNVSNIKSDGALWHNTRR